MPAGATRQRCGRVLIVAGSREHTRLACGVRRPRERHVAATRLTVLAEHGFRRDAGNGTRGARALPGRVARQLSIIARRYIIHGPSRRAEVPGK
jgi:hypothetical protein